MMKKTLYPEVICGKTPYEVRCVEEMTFGEEDHTMLLCSVSNGECMGLLMELTTTIAILGLSIVEADIKTIPAKETILGSSMIAMNSFTVIDGITQAKTFSPRRRRDIEIAVATCIKQWLESKVGMDVEANHTRITDRIKQQINHSTNNNNNNNIMMKRTTGKEENNGNNNKIDMLQHLQYEKMLQKGSKLTIEHNIVEERQLSLLLRLLLTKLEYLLSLQHARECPIPLEKISKKYLVDAVRECRRNFKASDKEVPSWVLSSARDLVDQLEQAIYHVAGIICLNVLRTWAQRRKLFESVFAAICLQKNFRGAKVRLHLNAAVVEGWLKGNVDIDIDDIQHNFQQKDNEDDDDEEEEEEYMEKRKARNNKNNGYKVEQASNSSPKKQLRQEWI